MAVPSGEGDGRPDAIYVEPIVGLSSCRLLSQGAEARVWETTFLGRPVVLKQRFEKKYRHEALDRKLTVSRMKQEVRSMLRARKLGILTPVVYNVEHEASSIYMELVEGQSVRDVLMARRLDAEGLQKLFLDIGRAVAVLHDGGLVHGDLTTSNMLVRDADKAVVLIDFGLSSNSTIPEDKSVDLYVLERAFTSAHAGQANAFDSILSAYRQHSRMWSATLNKFAEVRMRGRKRAMIG